MINRRTAMSSLAAGAASGLAAACRSRPNDSGDLIRAWFRGRGWAEPSAADIDAVRRYIAREPLRPEPSVQPGFLFNAEVDLG